MPSIRQNPYPDALPDFRNLGVMARAAIRGFERAAGGGEEEPHWNVVLEGLAERLPVSRRQWRAVKGVLPEAKEE